MGLTAAELYIAIKTNFEANTHDVITNTVDTDAGTVTASEPAAEPLELIADSDLAYLVQAIADAIISEIKSRGVDLGDSTADKLDVG